ncbi:hypothetical protein KC723_02380 [Candidatus Kaiserbacteria bacterium]|nr:hypothetical protein [Candidatus Kaiserbacteria bacterium]
MYEKLKSFLSDDTVYPSLILVLVGIISFGLGRISVSDISNNSHTEASISLSNKEIETTQDLHKNDKSAVAVVASKNGTKYHKLDCPGANQIAEKNLIEFASVEEAKAAGYTPAANCPSL